MSSDISTAFMHPYPGERYLHTWWDLGGSGKRKAKLLQFGFYTHVFLLPPASPSGKKGRSAITLRPLAGGSLTKAYPTALIHAVTDTKADAVVPVVAVVPVIAVIPVVAVVPPVVAIDDQKILIAIVVSITTALCLSRACARHHRSHKRGYGKNQNNTSHKTTPISFSDTQW